MLLGQSLDVVLGVDKYLQSEHKLLTSNRKKHTAELYSFKKSFGIYVAYTECAMKSVEAAAA